MLVLCCLILGFWAAQLCEQLLLHQYGGGEAVSPAPCEQLLLHPQGGSEAVHCAWTCFALFGQLLLHQPGGGGAVPLAQEQLLLH